MRINLLLLAFVLMLGAVAVPSVQAQGARTGPDPALLRDAELEKDSQHNLEVARNYFRLKKAYVAALSRLEEIIAGNPTFTKIEEVLLMAGQSSLWLAENKGKQKREQYVSYDGGGKKSLTTEQFREKGRMYLTKLVNEFPDSSFRKQAEEELRALDATKP
jgi:outer membrane protein assembly factor BamD (BamD/ComL family)